MSVDKRLLGRRLRGLGVELSILRVELDEKVEEWEE